MAFSAPLSLGGADIAYPGRPSTYSPTQPVMLPGVATAAYQPGIGFFEGAPIGNPETVTGQQNPPGTPQGAAGSPGAPSTPGVGFTVNTGQGFTVNPTQSGVFGALNAIGQNTPAAQFTAPLGVPAPVANLAVGLIPTAGPLLSLVNAMTGAFGPKGPFTDTKAIEDLLGRFDQFIPETPQGPLGLEVDITGALSGPTPAPPGGPVGPGSSTTGIPGSAENASAPAEPGAGDGEQGGDTKVICSELYRQGLMDDATYERDQAFGRTIPPEVRAGYLLWAPTVVGWMRRSPFMTRLVARIAGPWAREMAYGDSWTGRIVMRAGWVICSWLGRRRLSIA